MYPAISPIKYGSYLPIPYPAFLSVIMRTTFSLTQIFFSLTVSELLQHLTKQSIRFTMSAFFIWAGRDFIHLLVKIFNTHNGG